MKKIVFGLSLALLLLVGVGKVSAQTVSGTMSSGVSLSAPLSVGSHGDSVTALQQFLIAKGFLKTAAPTGYYGNLTAAGVSAFQAANNLPQVGRVGPMTLALLNQQFNGGAQQAPTPEQPSGNGGNSQTLPPGCLSASGFSTTTGLPCDGSNSTLPPGCLSDSGYSTTTGQPCDGTIVTILPPGCVSDSGYSSTTGLPCDGSQIVSLPSGCLSASGYSTTTGLPCSPQQSSQPQQQQNADTVITSPSSDPVSAGNTTATLTGQYPADSASTSAIGWFNYGTSATDLNQSTPQVALAGFTNNQGIFSASISNLQPNTTYYYEVEVSIQPEGMGDDVNGLVVPFTTTNSGTVQTSSASVVTDPTLDPTQMITSSGATISGQLINNVWSSGQNTTDQVFFNYGTSSTLAESDQSAPMSAFQDVNYQGLFTLSLTGLQPSSTYYFQACADSTTGTPAEDCGGIVSFTTLAATVTTTTSCGTTPSITITSPSAGQTLTLGGQATVTWSDCDVPANSVVDFELGDSVTGQEFLVGVPSAIPNLFWLHFPIAANTGSAVITLPSSVTVPTDPFTIRMNVFTNQNLVTNANGNIVTSNWSGQFSL